MTVITQTTYVEIDGLELATPAWLVTNLSALRGAMVGLRGEDLPVPYADGALPVRRWVDSQIKQLPFVVFGFKDKDGVVFADQQQGLQANLDELQQALVTPVHWTDAGTKPLRLHLPDGSIRAGDCQVQGIEVPIEGPAAALGTLDVYIPAAVLRDEAATEESSALVADGVPDTFTIPNPGNANQFEVVITLTGTASSQVRLTNQTWDPTDGTFLEFNGDLGVGDVVIDTAKWSALRAGVNVIDLVEHSGHERLFPLKRGVTNTIKVEPTGGNVTVTISHFAAYNVG